MSDERVWLRHKDIERPFHCPVAAVNDWREMGWEPGEPPEEVNPVVAERIAWEAEQRAAAEADAKTKTKPAKPAKTEE